MTRSTAHNGGANCRTAFVAINKTAVAAGSGDATEVDGAWIDRLPADHGPFESAKLVIAYTTTLAAAATLSFGVQFRDATAIGGTGAADFRDAVASTIVSTGGSGGTTNTGTVEIDLDMAGAREFIQAQITPNLSAGATDTCEWSAVLVMFGAAREPTTNAIASL
jgi:hypothetical protein